MTNLNATGVLSDASERPSEEGGGLDLRELLGLALAFWPLVLFCVLVAYGYGRYQVFLAQPQYSTDALVQTSVTAPEIAIGAIVQGFDRGTPRETEIALLRSRSIMGEVVDRLSLDVVVSPVHWRFQGQPIGAAYARHFRGSGFGSPPGWLDRFVAPGFDWGGAHAHVSTFDVPQWLIGRGFEIVAGPEEGTFVLRGLGAAQLAQGRAGELLRVALEPTGPEAEEEVLSLFVREIRARPGTRFSLTRIPRDVAIARLQRSFSAVEGSAPGMLVLRFGGTDAQEVTSVLGQVLRTYQARNVEQRSEQAQQTLAFLDQQLPALRERVESAEASLNRFRIQRGTADLTRETSAILERSLELEQVRTALRQRREEALQRFTENHPVIASLDSQLAQNAALLSRIDERVDELPEIQRQALRLQRESELATGLYTELLNRKQEFEMVRAGTTGSIRIIDEPLTPRYPVGPNTSAIMSRTLAAGVFLGLGIVFVIYLLRSGVEDATKVEKRLKIPTYGSIPYSSLQVSLARRFASDRSAGVRLLAELEPASITMEAIRSLRTALRFAQFDASNNITMITSPSPNVGKSFLSMNLGAMMAATGERVVVVDADLRRGRLHDTVGFDRAPGVAELIAGEVAEEAVVRRTPVNNLYLATTGTLPPNPSELLINAAFLSFLQDLAERFDQVIVDTPPVLAVTEAADIGRHCGTTIVVLKSGAHPMRMIEDTIDRLRTNGVRVRGTVFNQVGRSRASRYAYGYGYKRGYYYAGYRYAYQSRGPTWRDRLSDLARSTRHRIRRARRS